LWPALAIGVIVSMPRRAMADVEPLPLELMWDAPAGCPDTSFVRRRIEQLVHESPAASTHATAKIDSAADGRFHLVLTVHAGNLDETRTIDAASCSALADAFAVVVALAIDASHEAARVEGSPTGQEPAPDRERLPSTTPPTAVHPVQKESLAPRRPTPPATHLALGLGGSVVSGPLPQVSPGIVASAALRLSRFRVGVLGTRSFRQSPYFDRTAGASFDMIDVGAFGGYLVPLGIVAVGPYASFEATYVRYQGFGIRKPGVSSRTWPTAVLGGRVEVGVTRRVGLFARADVLLPIGAPTFTLATTGDRVSLHDPSGLAARFSLGAEIVLP
jgi:hypothetical protein